jgi:hypothetical protein
MKSLELYIPTRKWDLLKRGAARIGFCAVPYFLLAWVWLIYRDDRLFHGWWFIWCAVVIPAAGFALDVWRLIQTQDGGWRDVEPDAAPNGGAAAAVDNSSADMAKE